MLVTPGLCTLAEQFHFEKTATYMSMSESAVTALISLGIPHELSSFPETPTIKDGIIRLYYTTS